MTKSRWAPIDEPRVPAHLDVVEPEQLDASLDNVSVTGCDYVESRWDDVEITESRFARVAATGASAERLELTDVAFDDCELSGLSVESSSLVRVRFRRCRMAGVTMPTVRARHAAFSECNMAGAWLRAGHFERCEFVDCDLRDADLYEATIVGSRFVRCKLDGVELSSATVRDVALHGSTFDGFHGVESIRNVVIGSDQVMTLGLPVLAALGVVVDDDFDSTD